VIERALGEWRSALGNDAVRTDEETLERYARSTADRGTRPACILYPESTEQVQAVVRTASACQVPLYPISCGKNWGYGDACAPMEGAAIVDLGRMNRIVEVNTDLAYAIIEPGVTQGQLHEHLTENETGLWMDSTGAGPDASLVGNTLDRGFGHTRYGDHFLNTCGMEVVLADGRVLHTGFGHYEGARAAQVYPYGVGPFLDGLFCQSNLGIVTRIGLWLMPKPESFNFFWATVEQDADMGALINRLRPLRISGVLNAAIHIANDLRLLSADGRYPWEDAKGATPLPDDLRERLRHEKGYGRWNLAGSITGTKAHVAATRKAVREVLHGFCPFGFVSDERLAVARRAIPILNGFGLGKTLASRLRTLEPNYGLLQGTPVEQPLLGTQWRLRHPPSGPGDPLDFGCGVLWISPVLPMTGAAARELIDLVSPIFLRHGFDPLTTFTMINERAMVAVLNLAWDKAADGETEAATACYDEVMETIIAKGFIPYRTSPRGMPKLHQPDDPFWEAAAAIKDALDPQGIIAPGRYIPDTK
jgi:4-cresol dehydrogenase (hydroxylating) flavoprotein subunit